MTSRAISESPAARPAVESGGVRPLFEALERLGCQRARMLEATGLDEERLSDPDALVPCETYGALIAFAERARLRKNLGLQVARATPIGSYPLIDYLVLSSATVGQGLTRLAHYYRLVGASAELHLDETEDGMRVRPFHGGGAFMDEFAIALALLHLHAESAGRARAAYVSFTHQPDDMAEFEAVLKCPIHARATWAGYVLARETWELPLRRSDQVLLGLLERHADERLDQKAPVTDFVARVRQTAVRGFADRRAAIADVSRALALTPRTLQRRLAEHSTTFQRVVEAARREAAESQLAQNRLSVGEISYALGYSEPAAFHRAFRRWTGMTPQAFRARARRA